MLSLLFHGEPVSDTCSQLTYASENNSSTTRDDSLPEFVIDVFRLGASMTYYFPSLFHIFVTMSKRTWSTENDIYKKFKWIPFKIDSVPWNGLLKRHLWRRMIDTSVSLV